MASFIQKQVLIFLSLMLLLVGCIPVASPTFIALKLPTPTETVTHPPYPTPSATIAPVDYPTLPPIDQRLRQVLGIDVQCPYLCWQGIEPGVTSAEKARAMLGVTTQATRYSVDWRDGVSVSITSQNGLVKSINLIGQSNNINFFMSDFIELLGDPDEIRIQIFPGIECPIGYYFVYYSSRKMVLRVDFFLYDEGPSPDDVPIVIILNTEFDDNTFVGLWGQPLYEPEKYPFKRQPWLGFGHIHDYLPGRSLPTGPCQH